MSKKKTSTHKFYVVDLVRDKPKTTWITIPKYRVDVEIQVTTKGILSASDVPESVFKRLEKAGMEALESYEDIIAKEAKRLDDKIATLMASPNKAAQDEAQSLIQGVNASIKNALDSAEGAAQKAIEKRLALEIKGDKNLKEAQVRTVLKWTLGVISITTSVAKLVATSGADASAYVSIAKALYSLATDVAQHLKKDEDLRKDLLKGIMSYIRLRESSIMQAAERQNITDLTGIDFKKPKEAIAKVLDKIKAAGDEVTKGKDKKTIAKDFLDLAIKGFAAKKNDAETARKAYREHTTKTRQKIDDVSAKAGELQVAMKAAKALKEGVKIGAECMKVKSQVTSMSKVLVEREKFLTEMQELMAGNGMTIDDRTTLDKLKEMDKMSIAATGKELYSAVSSLKTMIEAVAKIA